MILYNSEDLLQHVILYIYSFSKFVFYVIKCHLIASFSNEELKV